MKANRVLKKQLNAPIASIVDILRNPKAPLSLKNQIEIFLADCRESLSQEAEKEIVILEMKLLLGKVLRRLK